MAANQPERSGTALPREVAPHHHRWAGTDEVQGHRPEIHQSWWWWSRPRPCAVPLERRLRLPGRTHHAAHRRSPGGDSMSRQKDWDIGPPGRQKAGPQEPPQGTPPPHRPASKTSTADRSDGGQCERNGLRALGFREAFQRGALDALRMLGRRCCLDCAAEAEQLADYYRGAADRWAS